MRDHDFWTTVAVGSVTLLFMTFPALAAESLSPYTWLIVGGNGAIFGLAFIERFRLRDT